MEACHHNLGGSTSSFQAISTNIKILLIVLTTIEQIAYIVELDFSEILYAI